MSESEVEELEKKHCNIDRLEEIVEELQCEINGIQRSLTVIYSKFETNTPIDGITIPLRDYHELLAVKKMYLHLIEKAINPKMQDVGIAQNPSYDPATNKFNR